MPRISRTMSSLMVWASKIEASMKNWEGGKVAFWESIHNSSSFFLECL